MHSVPVDMWPLWEVGMTERSDGGRRKGGTVTVVIGLF